VFQKKAPPYRGTSRYIKSLYWEAVKLQVYYQLNYVLQCRIVISLFCRSAAIVISESPQIRFSTSRHVNSSNAACGTTCVRPFRIASICPATQHVYTVTTQ